MVDMINNVFSDIEIFESQRYENMTVIGINSQKNAKTDLMTLDIGLDMGLVEITESSESGTVSEVKVVNHAVVPLLLLDGEEIIGSKQNRIINSTIIIKAESEMIVPVSCTEAGRWRYDSKTFNKSKHMASSRVRRDKARSVTKSLRGSGGFKSDQDEVWRNISSIQGELNTDSSTNALSDSYTQKKLDIDDYKKSFEINDNQNGIIVFINGKLVGMDLLYNTSRYRKYHDKIIESYIIDAISTHREDEVDDISVDDFIDEIKHSKHEAYKSVGLGVDYRVDNDVITGSAVVYEDHLISASFFRKMNV